MRLRHPSSELNPQTITPKTLETEPFISSSSSTSTCSSSSTDESTSESPLTVEDLPLRDIFPAILVVLTFALIFYLWDLPDLAEDILTASIRTFIQLTCLAAILTPFFKSNKATYVISYILCFMVPLAAYEATARSKLTYPGAYLHAMTGLGTGVFLMECIALFCVVKPKPWYSPRHAIPLAGMLLNNALTGTSLVLDNLLNEFTGRADRLEMMLAFGATPWEACWPSLANVLRQALVPTLNSMNVIGLVTIPGMMTGQVLAGASPVRAARYQIVIMYLIAGSTGLSAVITGGLTVMHGFNARGVFLSERIVKQSSPRVSQLFQKDMWKGVIRKEDDEGVSFVSSGIAMRQQQQQQNMQSGDAILEVDLRGTIASKYSFHAAFPLYASGISCLLGPSGSGKSTILRSIAELSAASELDIDQSSIILNKRERNTYSAVEWRQRVLYLPQNRASSLLGSPNELMKDIRGLSGRVALAAAGTTHASPPREMDVTNYLKDWGMASHHQGRSLNNDNSKSGGESSSKMSLLDRPWTDFSGGEAQRILLAIALATQPDVLLLDEPTSALDAESKSLVEGTLLKVKSAVLMVTHDEEQAIRISKSIWRLEENGKR